MLSPQQIEDWRSRDRAMEAKPRPGVWTIWTCIDGPLAGRTMRTRPSAKFSCIESCYVNRGGPVTARYEPTGEPGQLRFREFGYPGREPTGYDLGLT